MANRLCYKDRCGEMTDTKFPEDEEQMLELDFGIDTRTYWFEKHKVDAWFKRCIEDFPYIRNFDVDDPMFFPDCCRERSLWFKKWFGQFKEETRKPCKMVDDKHATCSNCGTPTLVTEPWMYQRGLCHTCFDKEKEDSQ